MKVIIQILCVVFVLLISRAATADVGTAFVYQGRFKDGTSWADGQYDFEFKLYDGSSEGNQLGSTVMGDDLEVADGYFTTSLDFNSQFSGNPRWLQISVRSGNESGAYTTLTPRHELKPTPYAMYAANGGGGYSSIHEVDGKVGIGVTSPDGTLHVRAGIAGNVTPEPSADDLIVENSTSGGICILTPDAASSLIRFGSPADPSGAAIYWLHNGASFSIGTTNALGHLRFAPGNNSEAMRIDSAGNVGIGTTSPTTTLDVRGNIMSVLSGTPTKVFSSFLEVSRNGTTGLIIDDQSQAADSRVWEIRSDSGNLSFATVNDSGSSVSKKIEIARSGNVGIGTTSPQGKLDVNGSIYQRGSQLHADYVYEPGYQLESIEEHAEYMWSNKHLPAVPGKTIDAAGLEVVEVGAHRKGILEELEKAHVYIAQLHSNIKQMQTANESLQEKNKELEQRLEKLEKIIEKPNH